MVSTETTPPWADWRSASLPLVRRKSQFCTHLLCHNAVRNVGAPGHNMTEYRSLESLLGLVRHGWDEAIIFVVVVICLFCFVSCGVVFCWNIAIATFYLFYFWSVLADLFLLLWIKPRLFLCTFSHFWDNSFFRSHLECTRQRENLENISLYHFVCSEVPSLCVTFFSYFLKILFIFRERGG